LFQGWQPEQNSMGCCFDVIPFHSLECRQVQVNCFFTNEVVNREVTHPVRCTVKSQPSFEIKHKLHTLTMPFSRKCSRLKIQQNKQNPNTWNEKMLTRFWIPRLSVWHEVLSLNTNNFEEWHRQTKWSVPLRNT